MLVECMWITPNSTYTTVLVDLATLVTRKNLVIGGRRKRVTQLIGSLILVDAKIERANTTLELPSMCQRIASARQDGALVVIGSLSSSTLVASLGPREAYKA
jgi:hypothetical protein